MLHPQLSHGLQPDVKQAQPGVSQRSIDTAAASVAADENMLDLKMGDGEFDDGKRVDVGSGDDVGDVAMNEDLARLETEDGCLGDTGVCAADPQNPGRLTSGRSREEVWIVLRCFGAPLGDTVCESVGEPLCSQRDQYMESGVTLMGGVKKLL